MLGLKVDKIFEQSENMKNNIEKINTTNIIKDAINLSLNKGNIKKLNDDKEETLNILYDKTIKNYLNYLKKCSLDEAEQKFKTELIENKKHIKSILIKSENEISEYKKKFLNASEENKNLTNKIYTLQNYNRELLKQNQTYLNNFEKLEKNYENISQQKALFEELMNNYPGKEPSEVIKELQKMKDETIQMMKDYQNISMKLYEIKEKQKNMEEDYKANMQKLSFENKIIKQEKNDIDYKYYYKIYSLEQHIADNEGKVKENKYLKNIIFHIYNLLFKEFALNRNIKIDKKYLNVKESDFNANFLYDNEIKNYINLMINTMHPNSYDIVFRETMGYLNMILRIYLPNKMELRFQPVKAFKEIKDFIDLKMSIIDNNKKIIEKYKKDLENRENEIFQLKQQIKALNKEYNSYKKIVEKEFEKTNRIIFQLKNNKEEENKFNLINNKQNLNCSKNRIEKNQKFLFTDSENESNLNNSKYKLRDIPLKKKKKKYKSINQKVIKNKNFINNEIILFKDKTEVLNSTNICKTLDNINNNRTYNDFLKLKKSNNNDKIMKNNGNQEIIDNFNNIKFLINETNRLFLYQPKISIMQDKIDQKDKQNILKTRVIRDYNDLRVNDGDTINKKIMKQINNLIVLSNK